jgi:hypothetical protein
MISRFFPGMLPFSFFCVLLCFSSGFYLFLSNKDICKEGLEGLEGFAVWMVHGCGYWYFGFLDSGRWYTQVASSWVAMRIIA